MSDGFSNPIIGGGGTLVYPAIRSPNFVHGASGWSINKDGSAEFDQVQLRGTFVTDGIILFPDNASIDFVNAIGPSAQPALVETGPQGFGGQRAAVVSLLAESSDSTVPAQVLIQSIVEGGTPAAPSTTDLLEVDGVLGFKGSDTSLSAPSPVQSLVLGTASQLTDTTRDYMLYLSFSGAGNLTIQIGNTNAVGRTILPATGLVAGALYTVRIPAGWFIKLTGTGTVAIASQNVVGC